MPRATIILIAILVIIVGGVIVLGTIDTSVPRTHVEQPIPHAAPAH